jgi:hypothetical protein
LFYNVQFTQRDFRGPRTLEWNSTSFTLTLENWYMGEMPEVTMDVQSVATSPKNVTIEWWFTGDAEGSGFRAFPVDSSEYPFFFSPSTVNL